jgi:hypothetical protein
MAASTMQFNAHRTQIRFKGKSLAKNPTQIRQCALLSVPLRFMLEMPSGC